MKLTVFRTRPSLDEKLSNANYAVIPNHLPKKYNLNSRHPQFKPLPLHLTSGNFKVDSLRLPDMNWFDPRTPGRDSSIERVILILGSWRNGLWSVAGVNSRIDGEILNFHDGTKSHVHDCDEIDGMGCN